MSSLILQTPSGWVPVQDPEAHTPGDYPNGNIAHIETLGDGTQVYICYWPDESPGDPVTELPIAGGKVITENDRAGSLLRETDELFYQIRPLGNNPDGRATKQLQYPYAAGEQQRQLEPGRLYPASNSPFAIRFSRRYQTYPGNPQWDGEGWRAEFVVLPGYEPVRDPSVRAVAIYPDAECKGTPWTTGGFILGPSDWQVDEEGNPIDTWYTECPAGRTTPEREQINHAILYASIQEGYENLLVGDEGTLFNYWENDQIGDWVYTGQTVQAMAETIVLVEDKSVFPVGAQVRIEGVESKVTSQWAGGEGIELSPYQAYTTGSFIQIFT